MSPSHPTPSRPRRVARLLLPPLLLLGTALAVPPTALADTDATPAPSATPGDPRLTGEDTEPTTDATAPEPATVTTADRTADLDPEGDRVAVAGTGYPADATVTVQTWVMSATESTSAGSAADPAELPGTTDEDNAVTVTTDGRGTFHAEVTVSAEFAAGAGLSAEDGVFEIRVATDGDPATPDAAPPAGGPPGSTLAAVPALVAPAGVTRIPVEFAPATVAAPAAPPRPLTQPSQQPETTSRSQPGAPAPMDPGSATGSSGQRLEVSTTTGLDPDGEDVTVTGSGYDTSKGVYVALCDISSASGSQAPSPCVGGVDMEGDSGSSVWVSSNPPPYGQGLAEPYSGSGTNGGFTVQLTVRAQDQFTDCLSNSVECAVVTRNDHTRGSDRGQDVFVPVYFTGQSGGGNGGDTERPGDSGSGSENDTSSGNSGGSGGNSGSRGDTGSSGSLPRTGSALTGLVVVAVTATALGAAAMATARRRRSAPATLSHSPTGKST